MVKIAQAPRARENRRKCADHCKNLAMPRLHARAREPPKMRGVVVGAGSGDPRPEDPTGGLRVLRSTSAQQTYRLDVADRYIDTATAPVC